MMSFINLLVFTFTVSILCFSQFSSPSALPSNAQRKANTAEEAVAILESGFKSGNIVDVTEILADPVGPQLKRTLLVSSAFTTAKKEMQQALDHRFGKEQDRIVACRPALDDYDEEVIAAVSKHLMSLRIDRVEKQRDRLRLTVIHIEKRPDGKGTRNRPEIYYAVQKGEYWQLLPEVLLEGIDQSEREIGILEKLTETYNRVAKEIIDGKYRDRAEAKAAAWRECEEIIRNQN